MKRLCSFAAIFAFLFAGVSGDPVTVVLDEGSSYTVSVMTLPHKVLTCHLETPHDGTIDFEPGDQSQTTDKYHVEPVTAVADCIITIQNVDANDVGIWSMTYVPDGEAAPRTGSYNITVNVAEVQGLSEEENIRLLSEIHHFTRQGTLIDISLNKESFEEDCYVRPPNGVMTKVDNFAVTNVKVHSSSNFVSCRMTIGPMSEDLLGQWRLCGESTVTKDMRCQPANVTWNNNNAVANWNSATQPRFNHPVHFGGSVNPGVAGHGDIITCHVITPNDEDLVITSDVKYPHIERIAFDRPSLCSVVFTDIDSSMIGNWVVYGKFRSMTYGLNEVRLPLNFFLYNENNPYEQAYNVTVLPEARHVINLGTLLNVEVTSSGQVDDCQFRMPSGKIFDLNSGKTTEGVAFKSLDTAPACQLAIGPVTEEMLGEWQIVGKFSNGNLFSERQQTFHIIQEDPSNPIIDEERTVINMTELVMDTEIGATYRVTINETAFTENESCHLLTPSGLQYALIDGFNIPNVEIIEANGVECGVVVNVQLDTIGEWTLIARATRLSVPIERRLSFTIRVEETFSLGNAINITEGTDLYIRLPNYTDLHYTCKLYGPDGEEFTHFELDPNYYNACGYIVRHINHTQHGIWQIVYGHQIIYRATLEVNILESVQISLESLTWRVGSSVQMVHGPEDAVYCKLEDPHGYTVFDGFGPCKVVVDRVTTDHEGKWRMFVVVPGTVMASVHEFYVHVQANDSGPVVTTSVSRNAPSVMLTCSLPAKYEVRTCKFRDPQGHILVASHAVGQDGYTFDGAVVNYESEADSHDCTLRLTNPTLSDLGLWRCGVDTEQGTFYGFLTVLCPWFMQEDSISIAVATEPVLKQDRDIFSSVEGESATLSCSIDAAIRYCYFRASNGTTFSVGPATSSSDYEYVGSGLDSGECGIRFNRLLATDSGLWSCHVGLFNTTAEEQRATFGVEVQEKLAVTHYWEGPEVIVRGYTSTLEEIEYCRYVRIDGTGFTSDNLPDGYLMEYKLMKGICYLRILNPGILDLHPWTVAAKLIGQDGEIAASTIDTLLISPPADILEQKPATGIRMTSAICLGIFVTFSGILLISAGVALIPKNNREWTYSRALHVRNSFRKQLQPVHIVNDLPPKV